MDWNSLKKQSYLVGGAVRDKLLGLPVHEKDYVVVGATPEDLFGLGFKAVGSAFPVFLHPNTHEEYALARTERKIKPGYHGFSCYFSPDVSLEDDLGRRDLTINAMAESWDGFLIDPYHGQKDLQQGVLRHVSACFVEDPVRILRIARFLSRFKHLNFSIAPETKQLMSNIVAQKETQALTPERVWKEFLLAMGEKTPEVFITTLYDCGALKDITPPFNAFFHSPSPMPAYHSLAHYALAVLQYAVQNHPQNIMRFAAFSSVLHYNQDNEVYNILNAFAIPKKYKDIAFLTASYLDFIHYSAQNIIQMPLLELEKHVRRLDLFRRKDRAMQIIHTLEMHAMIQQKTAPWCQFLHLMMQNKVDLSHVLPQQRLYTYVEMTLLRFRQMNHFNV